MSFYAAEARLGQFRLAQSALGYVDPVPQVFINGTDRSANVYRDSVQITKLQGAPATATFTIRDIAPVEGQAVKVSFGSDLNYHFSGHVLRVTQFQALGPYTNDHVGYSVLCQDKTWLLNKQHVFRTYAPDNVECIISDLISTFTSGFTVDHVEDGLGYFDDGVTFTMERVPAALDRLASAVNAYWYVDAANDIHFYSTDRVPSPHALSSSFRDFWGVSLETDLSQMVTRVYVEGAGNFLTGYSASGTTIGASFILDNADNFPDPFTEFDVRAKNYGPVGTRRLRYQRQSLSNQILDPTVAGDSTYTDVQTIQLHNGDEINLWRIIDSTSGQSALAALDGSDGIRESYIQDRRLGWDGMLERGTAELDRYKNPIERLRYSTFDPNTRPGGQVTVNIAAPQSISGTFRINKTVMRSFTGPGDLTLPVIDVEATSSTRSLIDIFQSLLEPTPGMKALF